MIDARATIHAGGTVDALAMQQHGIAVAMWQYWEARYAAAPTHEPTLRARNAWRQVVRTTEDYYGLPRSFESRSDESRARQYGTRGAA